MIASPAEPFYLSLQINNWGLIFRPWMKDENEKVAGLIENNLPHTVKVETYGCSWFVNNVGHTNFSEIKL